MENLAIKAREIIVFFGSRKGFITNFVQRPLIANFRLDVRTYILDASLWPCQLKGKRSNQAKQLRHDETHTWHFVKYEFWLFVTYEQFDYLNRISSEHWFFCRCEDSFTVVYKCYIQMISYQAYKGLLTLNGAGGSDRITKYLSPNR